MVLAVDIGNSNICIGGLDGADHRTIAFTTRMVTRPRCTEDEYAAEMKFLLQRLPVDPTACEGVIVCSVVPRLTGVQTSLRAISAGTAQLPPIAPEPPEHLIGANTVAALNNGAMFGTAAMLDGLADRVEAELGQPLTVVATGGLAPYIMPCCKRKIIYDADLLFKGLALIWERNGK